MSCLQLSPFSYSALSSPRPLSPSLSFPISHPRSFARSPAAHAPQHGQDGRPAQSAAAAKKAKWKAQSDQLRAAMRNNRIMSEAAARGQDIRTVALPEADPENDDRWGQMRQMRKFRA